MSEGLQKAIDEANKPKRGAKRKGKAGPSEVLRTPKKKVKKSTRKSRSPSLMVHESSESKTHFDLREGVLVQNEVEDTAPTSIPPTSNPIPMVSTLPTSSTPVSDFFHMPTPPSYPITTSSPITTTIPITTKDLCGCFFSTDLCSLIHSILYGFYNHNDNQGQYT